jgi:hypothetical protein
MCFSTIFSRQKKIFCSMFLAMSAKEGKTYFFD